MADGRGHNCPTQISQRMYQVNFENNEQLQRQMTTGDSDSL